MNSFIMTALLAQQNSQRQWKGRVDKRKGGERGNVRRGRKVKEEEEGVPDLIEPMLP